MDYVTTKPFKPSSNISEMVSNFAKVCKLRSIGVFFNENLSRKCDGDHDDDKNASSVDEDSSDVIEEMEGNSERVHPQPIMVPSKSSTCGDKYVVELFEIVSALKLAYARLQEAHVPYDLDRIIAADELVVARLEALCKIKRAYKEKQFMKDKIELLHLDRSKSKIEVNERLMQKLKCESKAKDAEILCLGRELEDLNSVNAIMADKMRWRSLEQKKVRVLNISTFEETFKEASKSIHNFAKPIISLMKASGWDLDLAVNSIESGVTYLKRSHKKYAFEAYIVRRMFNGVLLKSYDVDVLRHDDPVDYLIENPDSGFGEFCRKKYLFVVHPIMEMSFFGNLDQRMFLLSGKHPRTPFYQIFVQMAKWVWVLQGIATSIDPKAVIFAVRRGSEFSNTYLEPVEGTMEGVSSLSGMQSNHKVELMVMPGFKIGDKIVRSRVYVERIKTSMSMLDKGALADES